MNERYYTYKGSLTGNEERIFFETLFRKEMISYELKEEIKNILSEDEILELKMEFPQMPPGMLGMLIPKTNLYVNLKVTTITLIALILDAEITKGVANFVLAATGFNVNSVVKLNEEAGEKCILLEIYKKQHHKAKLDIFNSICGKECVNNNMNCKYRNQDTCTISKEEIENILQQMIDKNVFCKKGDFYKYNL